MASRLNILVPIDRLKPVEETERCSFCEGPIPVDGVPLMLWVEKRQATFMICDDCLPDIVAVEEG